MHSSMVVFSIINCKSNMPSNKILFLFTHISLLTFATTKAQDDPFFLHQDCSGDKTNANTSFQFYIKNLLSSLSSNAIGTTQFNMTKVSGENPSDLIYGMFMCRGDVSSHLCHQCVLNATQKLSLECSLSKQSTIWYDECMIRYSTTSLRYSISPSFDMKNSGNISNPESFIPMLNFTMNQTADEAVQSVIDNKKFATREANMSGFQTLYCLAQCTPDLSLQDCRTCLNDVIGNIPKCCGGRVGARVLYPSCNIRYELYPFYTIPSPTPTPKLVPETKTSHLDSKFSEDPIYLSHNCSNNKTFTANRTFQIYLTTLLSYLSSNASNSGKNFHKVDVANTVFGLFMCRGDLPSQLCGQCVQNGTHQISSKCYSFQEAIIWYSHCMIRYSYRNFFNKMEKSPLFSDLNTTNKGKEQNFFTVTVAKTLDKAVIEAGDSDERYGRKSSKFNDLQTLYTLAQCTQDLSTEECKGCLGNLIGASIPWSRLGSVGGRVLYPSCNVRFELFQFYEDSDKVGTPETERRKGLLRIIIPIVVSVSILAMLFFVLYYFLRRKARKSPTTLLQENFGREIINLEPLQFDLAIIQAATNNFSDENWIGKGGFGEVYKGILLDGRPIAVKKLSKSSKQGSDEFKNEVLLIAKLHHKNLVTFIGYCMEEEEKILIYEYVPNKSLDYFLFDSQRMKLLSWIERYNIIKGIARGILYLHEHSRLKIIHRDLKPSNVLLDENMIPKISDFGLAKIVEINEDRGNTSRIVGTYGYMSPEYAMLGQFSEKSDIFSFGVMVLEIVAGRRNLSSYEPHRVVGGFLSYVWNQWRDQTPLSTLDPYIRENYSEIEVIKCIQIGLLCVQQDPEARPTMLTIVSYLDSHHIELPTPQEPAYLLLGKMDGKTIADEMISNQCINTSTPFSINGMSISEFHPR